MKYRKIGDSDLEVSAVCLGTWVFGGDCWGAADDTQSIRVAEEAIEKGINFIDTAPIYGSGRSEEVVGKAMRGKRDRVIVSTKLGLKQEGGSIKSDLSAGFIREEIENSLRRLNVETIDLYQCHWPDADTPLEETFGELKALLEEGKVRYIGVSNFDRELIERVRSIMPVISDQMQYSLFDRAIEKELVPFCKAEGMSILAYGPLGGGILTGKYKAPPVFPKGDVRSFFYKFYREPFWSKARGLVSVLEEIAKKRKIPVSQVAINWVLSREEIASCIVGCRTTEQLAQNIGTADWKLNTEELTKIQEEYEKVF